MSGPIVRMYDKGIFSPSGLFETMNDILPNTLPPRWTRNGVPGSTSLSDPNNQDPTKKILTDAEINDLIGNASARPLAPETRLQELSKIANTQTQSSQTGRRIYNLSIFQIIQNIAMTYVNILNESLVFWQQPSIMGIFTREDRLIYIGISILIISILLLFIKK